MTEIEKVKFSCPKCNVRITIKSDRIQETIKCPKCSHSFLGMAGNDIEFFVEFELDTTPSSTKFSPNETPYTQSSKQEVNSASSNYAQPGEMPPIEKRRFKKVPYRPKRNTTNYEYEEEEDQENIPIMNSNFYDLTSSKDGGSFGNILLTAILLISLFSFLVFSTILPSEGKKTAIGSALILVLIAIGYFFIPLLIAYLADEKTGHAWLWFFLSIFLVPVALGMCMDKIAFSIVFLGIVLALQIFFLVILLVKDQNKYRPGS